MTFRKVLDLYAEDSEEYAILKSLDVKVRTMLYYRFCGCSKATCVAKAFNASMNGNSATRKFNTLLEENPGWELYLQALESVRERKGEVTANAFLEVLHSVATGQVSTSQPMVVGNKLEWVELEPTVAERIKSSEVALKNLGVTRESVGEQISFVDDL